MENPIKIQVFARYLVEQSDPEQDRYAFAYTIDITNEGEEPVQLINRHWLITDDNNRVEEVRGSGVVGLQPRISPGQTFQYTSGAVLGTEFGTMHGSYEMRMADGQTFIAEIPAFVLSTPHTLH